MQTYKALYMVEGKFLGGADIVSDFSPHSIAYCCSTCGNIWARIAVQDVSYWQFKSVPCEGHTPKGVVDWGQTPGSILFERRSRRRDLSKMWWGIALEHLPLQVLQREFEIYLKQHEEKCNEE